MKNNNNLTEIEYCLNLLKQNPLIQYSAPKVVECLLLTYFLSPGCGSKRGSLGGASDIGLEDHLGYHPGEFVGGYPGPPGTGRGGQPVNTDQYYADQYDQYYRWAIYIKCGLFE